MNSLSYGLLSLLTRKSYSGYDLMRHIQICWPARHSQIYPILAKLEQNGLITFERVEQSAKPDKKVYSLSKEGKLAVEAWLIEPSDEPSVRDELMLKVYCIHWMAPALARELFLVRGKMYEAKKQENEGKLTLLMKAHNGDGEGEAMLQLSPDFGAYILLNKAIMSAEMNLKWCNWVISLLQIK